jgi:hypothetical protein
MAGLRRFSNVVRCFALASAGVFLCAGQSFLDDLKAERDPGKRSQKALDYADEAFDSARSSYKQGDNHKGDADLDNMTAALTACIDSLSASHKSRFYKQAEMKVAYLQRRMDNLVQSLDVDERGWAEQTNRKLEEVHEKMLEGVMRK